MEDNEIIRQILLKLDNWVLTSTVEEEQLTTMDYNKAVTEEEILDWYSVAVDYAKAFMKRTDVTDVVVFDTAVVMWTAGLIWSKYNQQVNNMLDETNPNPFGYGDKLVIQAKEMLKPYKNYSFNAY